MVSRRMLQMIKMAGYTVKDNKIVPQRDPLADLIEYEELENLKKQEEDYYIFQLRKQVEEEIKEDLENMSIIEQLDLAFGDLT